jgi:hypothetical protein
MEHVPIDIGLSGRSDSKGIPDSIRSDHWLHIPMVGSAIMAAHNSSACQVSISHDQLNRVFAGQGTNLEEQGCTGQPASWWHEAAVQAPQPTGSIICRDRRERGTTLRKRCIERGRDGNRLDATTRISEQPQNVILLWR